jgi:prevent-host-death family protein
MPDHATGHPLASNVFHPWSGLPPLVRLPSRCTDRCHDNWRVRSVRYDAPRASAGAETIREVGVRELNRGTTRVLEMALAGERVIVTRDGQPIAVLLSVDQAIELLLFSSEEFVRMRLRARQELGE